MRVCARVCCELLILADIATNSIKNTNTAQCERTQMHIPKWARIYPRTTDHTELLHMRALRSMNKKS